MSFSNYLKTIESLDVEKFDVENIRSILMVPTTLAKLICEMGVVDHLFERKIGVICPNSNCQRIIHLYDSTREIPASIKCVICEDSEEEEFLFDSGKMQRKTFYKLVKATFDDK